MQQLLQIFDPVVRIQAAHAPEFWKIQHGAEWNPN